MAGRPRFQNGQLTMRGGYWTLRCRDYANGGKRKDYKIALASNHPDIRESETTKAESRFADQLSKIRAEINRGHVATPDKQALTLGQFIEQSYFPRCEWRMTIPAGNEGRMEPSTLEGYRDIFKNHIKENPIAQIRRHEFTPIQGRRFMESVDQKLSHQTHLRIKAFLSGVFTWAIQDGAYVGANPMQDQKAYGWKKDSDAPSLAHLPESERIRKQKIRESNNHAYTLEEVGEMLEKLPEPARTVCAVAAFQGLTRSELRGLKWDDIGESTSKEYSGMVIKVGRKVWGTHIGPTKTEAREAEIPVISYVQKILPKYKKQFPPAGDGWVFRGNTLYHPLDLDNLSRRVIPDYINGAWFGWHAFRRGLGSRLNELGVDAKTIQIILRHANVSTTQAHYILPDRKHIEAGLKKLNRVAKKYGIK
jgi:integrase